MTAWVQFGVLKAHIIKNVGLALYLKGMATITCGGMDLTENIPRHLLKMV